LEASWSHDGWHTSWDDDPYLAKGNDHPHEADGSTDVETHHIGEDCWGKGKRKGKPYGRSGTSIRQALEEFSQRGFHGKVALREALALI